MREMLFRAKEKDNGEWVYGWYCRYPFGRWPLKDAIIPSEEAESGYHCYVEVDPSTVGQYTGLLDKNGGKIFEGDVLQFFEKRLVVWWNEEAFQWQAQERKEVTCTYSGASTCGIFDNIDLGWIYAEIPCLGKMSTEVIGNRWDNPELLEEVSDNG